MSSRYVPHDRSTLAGLAKGPLRAVKQCSHDIEAAGCRSMSLNAAGE